MKRKSKWLSVCVAVIMLATMMPFGMIANAASTPITSLSQITDMSGNYVLGDNITVASSDSSPWTPIGTKTAPFTGTLDGGGFTITFGSSMKISPTSSQSLDASYNGLFGYTSSTANIRNLKIIDSTLTAGNYDLQVFGFIAAYNAGTIENCAVTNSNILVSAVRGYTYYIGSIAGYNSGTITKSYNTSDIFTQINPVGASTSYLGGIVGYNNGTVSLSYNTGTVSAENKLNFGIGFSYLGGISGENNKTITNCYNSGNLSSYSEGSIGYAGGISGENGENGNKDNTATGSISLSYNAGLINGKITGGITALNEYTQIKDSNGNVTSTVQGTVTNSYYYDASAVYGYINGDGNTNSDGKRTDTQMKILSNFTGFDSSTVWGTPTDTPVDYPYPALKDVAHIETADNTTDYAGGNGKLYNPYKIENKTQLNKIRNSEKYLTSCYVLTKDILFTNWDFNSLSENEAKYFKTISTVDVVDNTSSTSATAVDLKAGNLTTLAELIASDNLPTAILINKDNPLTKTYAQITDWSGTFDGKTTDGTTEYTLTPIWEVPSGYKTTGFTAPTFNVKVSVAQTENFTTATAGNPDVVWSKADLSVNGTLAKTLDKDENITDLATLVASGKIPSVVRIKETPDGGSTYRYRWWKIGDWTSSPAFEGKAGTYTLTQIINTKTVTVSLTVDKDQTAAITAPADGEFYNGGLGWIPIGVKTADTASTTDDKKYYTGAADLFRGAISGNDHYIYNLKINANGVDGTTANDAYAGLVGINNGVIQKLNIDKEPAVPADKNALLSGVNQIALFSADTFSTYANVSASKNAYAGLIAGTNDVNGKISYVRISGSVSTLANSSSFAGGITGINRSYVTHSYNFSSVTSNSKTISACAGGIAGSNSRYIENTANTGTVIAGYGTTPMSITLAQAYSYAVLYAGGITGFNSSSGAKIIESHNIGGVMTQITSASTSDYIFAGGLAGYVTGTLKDSTAANNTIDAASTCWDKTSKYSVEYASDAETGYTTGSTSDITALKTAMETDEGSALPTDYGKQYFLSFNFPNKADSTPYNGFFGTQSDAEAYVDTTITSSNATIYDNTGATLVTTKTATYKGNKTESNKIEGSVKSGYELMKVTYTPTGKPDQTVEFITHIAEAPVSLTLGTSNVKKSYSLGDAFDKTGLTVTAKYSDNSTATLSSSEYTITTAYTTTSLKGDYTVTISSNAAPSVQAIYSITASERMTVDTDSGCGYTILRDADVNDSEINYITGTGTKVIVSDFRKGLNQNVVIKTQSGGPVGETDVLKTGMTVELSDGSDPLMIVVRGDTSGDGDVTPTDLVQIKSVILSKSTLNGAYFAAGDTSGDGKISPTDLIQVKRHILGKSVLK